MTRESPNLESKTQNAAPRIGVFGGVYSNYLALKALLKDSRAPEIQHLYCLGDLGAFGPLPESFKETTITRSETDLQTANAVTLILAITISPGSLTTTLFGTPITITRRGCGNFNRKSGSGLAPIVFCFVMDHRGK